MEEYYAQNLQAYYDALTIGESHNYYEGRAGAEITQWVNYFCAGMADAFAHVRVKATEVSGKKRDHSRLLRELDQRQKQILPLFKNSRFVTTRETLPISCNFTHERRSITVTNGLMMTF